MGMDISFITTSSPGKPSHCAGTTRYDRSKCSMHGLFETPEIYGEDYRRSYGFSRDVPFQVDWDVFLKEIRRQITLLGAEDNPNWQQLLQDTEAMVKNPDRDKYMVFIG